MRHPETSDPTPYTIESLDDVGLALRVVGEYSQRNRRERHALERDIAMALHREAFFERMTMALIETDDRQTLPEIQLDPADVHVCVEAMRWYLRTEHRWLERNEPSEVTRFETFLAKVESAA